MCGIFGLSLRDEGPIGRELEEGLKLLEYRGYDSVGIAVSTGKGITIRKMVGSVSLASQILQFSEIRGISGIGHTRWATHGGVEDRNAHPHPDCREEIAVVHNGIIENYEELRELLKDRGHRLRSDTDTEVIAHLLEEYGANEEGIRRVMDLLQGSFAVAALLKNGTIICMKRGSPLVVVEWEGGSAIASDPLPLLKFSKDVIRLGDDEYCIIRGGKLYYPFQRRVKHINWNAQDVELGSFSHYMEKEIFEQPTVLKNLSRYLKTIPRPRLKGTIHIVAAGTSYHAGLYGEFLLRKRGIDARAFVASEYRYWKGPNPERIIVVSQSGETADVIEALKGLDVPLTVITNVPTSTLASMADDVFLLQAGPEIGVAATKTYTAELLTFYYLATGKIPEELPSLVYETLIRNRGIKDAVAEEIKEKPSAYFLGRGINSITAKEGALKLKEIAYIHAEGYPAGESKHGPIALVEPGFPVFVVAPRDKTFRDTVSNMEEMRARGARIILLSQEPQGIENHLFSIPYARDPLLYPIISIVPLQLLAYRTAVLRELNPDRPRNLAKSVTVK